MREFRGKVAVVTGAGSGIGKAIGLRAAAEGMRLVLADIDDAALESSRIEISDKTDVIAMRVDVSHAADLLSLAELTCREFGGKVHLLCNNAGVLHVAPLLEHTTADWDWILGVNLMGAINGVLAFSPLMLHDEDRHIVNVASAASFFTGAGLGAYKVSKHALLAYSEILYHEMSGTGLGVTALCPDWVDTRIAESERLRPPKIDSAAPEPTGASEYRRRAMDSARAGASPASIADLLFDAIIAERFYAYQEASRMPERLRQRTTTILDRRNPAWSS